jgi:hypothetical protein
MPETKRAAFTSTMVSGVGSFNTLPITRGIAMIPPSAARRCCRAKRRVNPKGGFESTG